MAKVANIDSKKTSKNQESAGVRRVEQALEHIEQGIREGRYLPGHRLVEAELAENSGLSIGPIREALRVLAGEGMVDLRPYRGAVVTRLTVEQITKVYQAAKGVVYISLQLAAEVCQTRKNRKLLKAAMDEVQITENRPLTEFLMAVTNYFFVLHQIVDNPYLTILINRLHLGLVHREVSNLHPALDRKAIVKAYSETTKALLTGDAETAVKHQFKHLDTYIEMIEQA